MFRLLEKKWSADLAVELRSLERRRNEHFQIIFCFFEHESDISDNEFLPFTCECLVWPGDTFLGLVSESWFSGILTRSHPPVWPLAVRFRSGNYLSRLFLHLTDTRWVTGSNLKPFTTVKHWVCTYISSIYFIKIDFGRMEHWGCPTQKLVAMVASSLRVFGSILPSRHCTIMCSLGSTMTL